MKISKIIKLSSAFATEVNVLRDYHYRNPSGNELKVKGYLPNKSSRSIIKSIISSCSESTDEKVHLISASYGTGKSYLLLMIANLLSKQSKAAQQSLVEKIKDKETFYKDGLTDSLNNHINNSNPFLVVIPEYGDSNFDHALLEALKFSLKSNSIEYIPKTNYEEAIKTIVHWQDKNPGNYKLLCDLITNSTIQIFIEQLKSYNQTIYSEFKKHFNAINGVPFSESHASAYPIFADTAKAISSKGFRGIAIIYDEFGEMLGQLINSSTSATGASVQQFIEDVKDKKEPSNIIFVSASHQDPKNIRVNKEVELKKIIGRFKRHQLMVSEAEGEEIMGKIFIKEDPKEFSQVLEHKLFNEHLETIKYFNLYPDKDDAWIKNAVLENLYPLHPLTSYILPRLSSEFAQNTRSMFNFLSPVETKEGAFKSYLETNEVYENGCLNLFTPDLLLEFFLKNLREDKSGNVQIYYEAYLEGKAKVTDPNHQCVMKNIFILNVIKDAKIQAKRETLFWTMNWEDSRRTEFYHLLDDLVNFREYLELNPIDKTYQFPHFGSAPLSKIIEEEKANLPDFGLFQSMTIWKNLFPQENQLPRDHNNKFGCNRYLSIITENDVGRILQSIKNLEGYYNQTIYFHGNGLVFYLLGKSEDEVELLKSTIKKESEMLPYIIYGTPVNLPQFENLINETLHYVAIINTAKRQDILTNAARLKSINEQIDASKSIVTERIKTLFEPVNWKWNYQQEFDVEITSKPKFSNWVDQKIDLLFTETPKIIDDALWFIEGRKGSKDRNQALISLITSDTDRIPLRDDNNSSASNRIIKNFFANIGLTTDKKRERGIQFGEIKMPDKESQVFNAWKLIESKLKTGSFVNSSDIVNPLIQQPFGLSESIIKFLLAAYIRYDRERIIVTDSKKNVLSDISVDVINDLVDKPGSFFIRKIEISGPELRYLGQLKKLFEKKDVNTWMDVTQKFIGIAQYLTPLQKGILKNSGNQKLIDFYESLDTLKTEYNTNGSDKERISKEYFQLSLPSMLLNSDPKFIEDNDKVGQLVNMLSEFKKYPIEKESGSKMLVIQELSQEVFKKTIGTKAEIIDIVLSWFKALPTSNQNGKYNSIIMKWLNEIKTPSTTDPFEIYLEVLSEKPIKDWENFSYEMSRFISRFLEYKKTIEEYTKSPIEVLQIIARSVFQKSSEECDSENSFDAFFKNWWDNLPDLNKAEQYCPETNLLISQITLSGAVKARYLEIIPQGWKQTNFIPDYIPQKWESWKNEDAILVSEKYNNCINEVNQWKPPVEEKDFYQSIGIIFTSEGASSLQSLYEKLLKWHAELPSRTKNINWGQVNKDAEAFLRSLVDQISFAIFIKEEAPSLWKLPNFKKWNKSTLEHYVQEIKSLKAIIESYKRPLFELVQKIEEKINEKSSNIEEYCLNLNAIIKETDAFKNKIDFTLLKNNVSQILCTIAEKDIKEFNFLNITSLVSRELKLDADWHQWSDKEEKDFISGLKKGVDNLLKWKFPEAEKLKKAKVKVKISIAELQKDLQLNDTQMRKVLNDIIEEK